jgi:hypothetical protein
MALSGRQLIDFDGVVDNITDGFEFDPPELPDPPDFDTPDLDGGVPIGIDDPADGGDNATGAGLSPEEARLVAYLYEAGLDRDGAIDAGGLNYWIDQREAGLSERGLALEFLRSDEFEAAFGEPLEADDPAYLDDAAFVAALYENVLDREADAGGRAYWLGRLGAPGVDRADLLLEFARSPENVAGSPEVATLAQVEPGVWDLA